MKRDEVDPIQWNLLAKMLAYWNWLPLHQMTEIVDVLGDRTHTYDVTLTNSAGESTVRRVSMP